MRELTQEEAEKIGGGASIRLSGNSQFSTSNIVMRRLGAAGVAVASFDAGFGLGSMLDSHFGWSQEIGEYAYENS
jgi:1,4-dihydroxy-2-naphthoyl-CoA synthase